MASRIQTSQSLPMSTQGLTGLRLCQRGKMSGLWPWDPGVLHSSSPADLWLSIIHQLLHSVNKSSLLRVTKKKDKLLLVPSGVERPHQVINETIRDEVNTVEKMTTQ